MNFFFSAAISGRIILKVGIIGVIDDDDDGGGGAHETCLCLQQLATY